MGQDTAPPEFSDRFRDQFDQLMRWRRDVRRFRPDPVPAETCRRLAGLAALAPSVGLSQPWRFVSVESDAARAKMRDNFETENARALAGYDGERAQLYAGLKLSGLDDAPVHWAVFCDEATDSGSGLGARTMPEMRRYSVVAAITQIWLAARAEGLGIGWVSILDPDRVVRDLGVDPDWRLVAYLCVGYPAEDSTEPELARAGWETRSAEIVMDVR
ncbi:5,6-dimethylbenzimidazole synthase [Oceanomicrobium pacificus]|uniref:5,6-dimethylbenzimidazole synthase n=1 Tax=Oceanomicrobium pacificus TaxID=2692916 RepID=A0A6B0U006_9RHOB|nr:5,6-dimethylbenzimidazole synthase [Oceanomicrobium pacificus]MXU66832.1 5,6-dimethylbenzimidazole synthase [Oceanomicrobium pacificus]